MQFGVAAVSHALSDRPSDGWAPEPPGSVGVVWLEAGPGAWSLELRCVGVGDRSGRNTIWTLRQFHTEVPVASLVQLADLFSAEGRRAQVEDLITEVYRAYDRASAAESSSVMTAGGVTRRPE